MITVQQAKNLKKGDEVFHVQAKMSNGRPKRFRINSKPKTWKTKPSEVQLTIKFGLQNVTMLDNDNLEEFSLDENIIVRANTLIEEDDDFLYEVAAMHFPRDMVTNIKHTVWFKIKLIQMLEERNEE